MTVPIILLIAIALGLISAGIAKWKGRWPLQWILYGALFSVVAIPFLLLLERRDSDQSRSPWIYYLAAVMLLTVAGMLIVYRLQNASDL